MKHKRTVLVGLLSFSLSSIVFAQAGEQGGASDSSAMPSAQSGMDNQGASQQQQSGAQTQMGAAGQNVGTIRQVQERLKQLGFYTGRVDGLYGPLTNAAVRSFQQERGLRANGTLNDQTLAALGALGTQGEGEGAAGTEAGAVDSTETESESSGTDAGAAGSAGDSSAPSSEAPSDAPLGDSTAPGSTLPMPESAPQSPGGEAPAAPSN